MRQLAWVWLWALSTTLAWAQAPVPMLWKVSDADNSIYLLGAFHMLKASDYPLAPSVNAALADVQQVYFEVAPREMADPALPAKMVQAATRTDGTTLQQAVSPATWRALQRYAAKNQMDVAGLQGLKPWFVGMLLALTESQKLGLNPALGLDRHLMERAAQAGTPTQGLETADAQIAMLDSLDATLQDAFLQDTLREMGDFKGLFEALHTAWRQGDVAALERTALAEMREQYPVLYQRVNVDRNKAWLPQLDALLRDKARDNVLVVVGALHLVGSDGVVRMLADKGYRVERLR
nr:TraB/GumN family protein [uncultured Rhodoferax sp.]